jgi:hypothetical protein
LSFPLYFDLPGVFSLPQEDMKTPLTLVLVATTVLAFSGCGKKEGGESTAHSAAPKITPARTTSFDEVTSQLDSGGSVYGYLATDQWMRGLSTNLLQLGDLFSEMPGMSGPDAEHLHRAIGLIASGIEKSGLENLNGVGISGIQVSPTLHRTKIILHHGEGKGGGVFWNVLGQKPHELAGLNLLTTNTALAAYGDLDVALLWKTVESGVSQVPELAEALGKWPQTFERQTKIPWSKFIASLGGEVGFVLTLDQARQISLPGEGMELPEPGLLIAVKVNDSLLYDRISAELKKSGQAQITDEKGLKMSAMRVPFPLPMDLQITVANSEGYFFFASSPAMVRNALAVHNGDQPGLRKTAGFAELMKFLPNEGNRFAYADPRFSATIQELQKEFLNRQQGDSARAELMQKLFLDRPAAFGMSISRHTSTGWEIVSVGNQDSATTLVAMPALAGVGVASAMVLPALNKAKERTKSIKCVNNMKQIGLAFRIWEGDHDDQFPFNVSTEKGGTRELCNLNSEGFDLASYRHFQVMSNELNTPKILVCPEDTEQQAASDFSNLQPENVSYQIRSSKDVNDSNPTAVLLYCPVHHHICYADGSVVVGSKDQPATF